ncbi:MAG: hypothetical protein JO097_00155 [Acidobacteriaceae bacterium]|nr:hypothetical protein [Acidobacteriaceae bacterium]MBV9300888.1 hypothetical protein [Acidobacteriaceae bacterium]
MTVPQPAPENVFDSIAKLLKPEQREYFYQRMTYFRHLRPEDEILRIAEAMGFLAVVIRETPLEMAQERELFGDLLASSLQAMQVSYQASVAWQKQMENRMAKLPEEIARGMNADIIAAKLSESIRQQFQQTGLPIVADTMSAQATTMRQASRELTAALEKFAHPSDGAVSRVTQGLRSMKADLQNASEHIRAQMNGLGKQLNWTIGVFCSGTLVIGLILGSFYQRWVDAPPPQPAQAPAPAVQSAPPSSSPTIQPNHKRRTQPSATGQVQ